MTLPSKTALWLGASVVMAASALGFVGVTAASAAHPSVVAVAPGAPRVAATCSGTSTLTLPKTTGVSYTVPVAGPYTAAQSLVVTAQAHRGYTFAAAPSGWLRHSGSVETYVVRFGAAPRCVTPVRPILAQARCAGGPAARPGLRLLDTDGVDYTTSADAPYAPGQRLTVTARASAGNRFAGPLAAGWHAVNSTTQTYSVHFAAC